MRIGIDVRTLSYEYTGIPIYVHDLIKCWNNECHEEEFFLYSNRSFELDFILNNNFHIIIDKHKFGGIWEQKRMPYLLQRDKINVFWEPMNFLPRKVEGIKYIVTIHDLAVYNNPKLGSFTDGVLERLLLPISCKRADKIIAISESTKNDIKKYLKVQDNKISIIYNGDSPYTGKGPSYTEDKEELILNKWKIVKNNYLLFIGTIEPRKNISTIVKAFEVLKKKNGYIGKLILVGKYGWRSNNLLKQINSSEYKKDIVLTNYVTDEEKECLYRNATCFVFPSLYEGFGFPIVEAMSVGIPIITSKVSSMPEVGGEIVSYVEKNMLTDYYALAERILEILSRSQDDLENYILKCKRRVTLFNRITTARETMKRIKGAYDE